MMTKEIVLITGANGLVAKALADCLSEKYEVRFLTRKKVKNNDFVWDINKGYIDEKALQGVNHIVHLAGAGIADKRWTDKRKKEIFDSRITSTKLLLNTLKNKNIKITSFISASAIGYYGTVSSNAIFDESSPKGDDFLSDVCYEWEQVSKDFSDTCIFQKRIILRFGIILAKEGGALQKMLEPIKRNVGAVLGKGNQFMPWIHIDDLCDIITFAIGGELEDGVYNTVAPEHVANKDFTRLLASIYHKKIWLPNVPSWVIRLLFGKSSILLLEGTRVSSEKLMKSGYHFKFPTLKSALLDLK